MRSGRELFARVGGHGKLALLVLGIGAPRKREARESIDRFCTRAHRYLGVRIDVLSVAPDVPIQPRGTVIVADDDAATRILLCRVLARAAFTVYAVENGALACEEVRLRRPDVLLLDWVMPVMDGRQAVEVLKADVATRAIPIVMLTTHAQLEDRIVAREAGVQDYLTKPFDARELVACIEAQIRWRAIVAGDALLIPMPAHSGRWASYPDRSRPSARS